MFAATLNRTTVIQTILNLWMFFKLRYFLLLTYKLVNTPSLTLHTSRGFSGVTKYNIVEYGSLHLAELCQKFNASLQWKIQFNSSVIWCVVKRRKRSGQSSAGESNRFRLVMLFSAQVCVLLRIRLTNVRLLTMYVCVMIRIGSAYWLVNTDSHTHAYA